MKQSLAGAHGPGIHALEERFWDQRSLAATDSGVVEQLLDALAQRRNALAALMLGVMTELNGDPETREATRGAVRAGIPQYLDLLSSEPPRGALSLALLYLLAHFPEERERIVGTIRHGSMGHAREDVDRLERLLSFQEAGTPGLVTHLQRHMRAATASSPDVLWREVVASILAPLGAEAAEAISRQETGG